MIFLPIPKPSGVRLSCNRFLRTERNQEDTKLDGADIIYAVGPAYSTKPFAEFEEVFR